MSDADAILSRLDVLGSKLDYIEADIKALRRHQETDRQESRDALIQLRADLTLIAARLNGAVETNKKKLTGLPRNISGLSPD